MTFLFTSENVGCGHPDKICDQISDSILDEILKKDKHAKVAIEALVKSNTVVLAGEISSTAKIDYRSIVADVIRKCGYTHNETFDYRTFQLLILISQQSLDIFQCVQPSVNSKIAAGDQGMMFGYATNETPQLMPLTWVLATALVSKLNDLRKDNAFLRSDCKAQVTVEYESENGALIPLRVHTVVVSCQHTEDVSLDFLQNFINESVIKKVIPHKYLINTKLIIQPSGLFVIGGPSADSGLTGRKIVCDTYGGFGAHGGGCFSGKDCSKVDRSGAYIARHIAKTLVARNICKRVLVQLSYAIGLEDPLSLFVNTYGTSEFSDEEVVEMVYKNFDLTPSGIINKLGLDSPIFAQTACLGHFGNNEFPWEKIGTLDTHNLEFSLEK